ncbi:MAG: helix-turn-helix transcriptional regulator [Actinobacteria bacterium]|nr:helix-turn-helix transcriptional regulator [Actinomycetota bacterium]
MASSLPAQPADPADGAGAAGVARLVGGTGTGTSGAGARTEDIRQTAAGLFERRGYAATTISDIAEAAGILPGSLYHHFASKEDIAVDLLNRYSQALAGLGAAAAGRSAGGAGPAGRAGPLGSAEALEPAELTEPSGDPGALLRRLAAEVAGLAFAHPAAVRLSAYEAPSVATGRLVAAIQFRSPALDRAWRTAVQALAGHSPVADLGLLRFTVQRVTAYAPLYYPAGDAGRLAGQLCDLLLHGLLTEPPSFTELDRSAAYRTALEVTATWGVSGRGGGGPGAADDVTGAILAAARREFARRGYEATTIRDIAGAAGIGMATLYRRVDSKEALLQTIVDGYADRLDEAFAAVLAADPGGPAALAARVLAITWVFAHASRHFRAESRIVALGWYGREETASPVHRYFVATQQRLDTLAELLRPGLADGTVRPIAGAAELAQHLRTVLWLRFYEHGRTSEARAFAFLRQSLLGGALARE